MFDTNWLISKLVKMENPYKEPQKGCLLCNVTVDYKNIQVRVGPVLLQSSRVHLHFFPTSIWTEAAVFHPLSNTHLSSLQLLSQFISPHTGKIYGRHFTGEPPPLKLKHGLLTSSPVCLFLAF